MANDTATSDLPFGLTKSYDASLYPSDASQDLAQHYSVSQQIADKFGGAGSWGMIPSALAGLYQEASGLVSGSPSGLSLDDLAANYAGYVGATPEQAGAAGFFEHTELYPGGEEAVKERLRTGVPVGEAFDYGLGEGTLSENWDKIRALHSGSFPLVRSGIEKLENLGGNIYEYFNQPESFVMPASRLDAQGRTISPVSTAPGYGVPEGYEVIGTSPEEQLAFVIDPLQNVGGESSQALEGMFPGGQPPILPEQPFVRGSLGYNVRDETARLAALASGRLSEYGDFDISPEVQSQSAQALIRSFAENPEVASLVSRKGDMRSAVDEALGTYLPSAMGVYDDPAQFQEPLTEARKGIMDLIDWGRVAADEKAGVFDVNERSMAKHMTAAEYPSQDYGPTGEFLGEFPTEPGSQYVTHSQEIADLKNVEHDYTSDLATWNRNQFGARDISDVDEAKYNVMKHLNIVFGGSGGEVLPDFRESAGRKVLGAGLINIPIKSLRDKAADKFLDSPTTIQKALDNLSGQDQRVKVMDSLTDMANNDTFRTLRDEGVSKEDAYKSGDVVWDQRELRDLAQELINNERDPETITVENVKEESKKASKKRTDVREEARKPTKTSKPKKAEVTPTVNIADLMREANRQRSAEMNKQLEAQRRKDLGFGWGDMWT